MVDFGKLPTSRKKANELGSVVYFTGKPCKHGHIDKRYTLTGQCSECGRITGLRDYYKNLSKRRGTSNEWKKANAERVREAYRRWKAENPEKIKQYKSDYANRCRQKRRSVL